MHYQRYMENSPHGEFALEELAPLRTRPNVSGEVAPELLEKSPQMEAESAPPPYSSTGPGYQQDVEAPPNYEQTNQHFPLDPPPTYDSLYGRMKSARAESHGNIEFAKKFCTIIIGTIGCTIMLGIIMAVPVAMIIIGALYKNDCKAENYIPIYLIVAGSFGILKNLSSLIQRCLNKDKENSEEQNAKTNPFDSTLNCFLFAWFIAGNVWIYRTYNHWSPDPSVSNYCHPTLYYFAFWVTTATYILLGTVCCCTCCLGIGVAIFGKGQ